MPTRNVAALASRIGRRVNMAVDTSGCATRLLRDHQASRTAAPSAAADAVRGEVQPQAAPG